MELRRASRRRWCRRWRSSGRARPGRRPATSSVAVVGVGGGEAVGMADQQHLAVAGHVDRRHRRRCRSRRRARACPAAAAMLMPSLRVPFGLSPKRLTTWPRTGQRKPSPDSDGGFIREARRTVSTSSADMAGAGGMAMSPGRRTRLARPDTVGIEVGVGGDDVAEPQLVAGGDGGQRVAAADRLGAHRPCGRVGPGRTMIWPAIDLVGRLRCRWPGPVG